MNTNFYQKAIIEKHLYKIVKFAFLIIFTVLTSIAGAQNFHLVKDINSSTDGNPANYAGNRYNFSVGSTYALLNGVAYFGADDGINGRGLWRSDGTAAGTYQVKDSIAPNQIIVLNGKLFFTGNGMAGLWTSDGTEAGTVPVLDVVPPGLGTFAPNGLTIMNNAIYFSISGHARNDQLWKTDGTANGTVLIKDFYSADYNTNGFSLYDFHAIKNKLYFSVFGFSPSYSSKLWVSDGSSLGTYLISNNVVEPAQIIARSSDNADPFVYFTAAQYFGGPRSLYITNGQAGVAGVASGFSGYVSSNYFNLDILNVGGFIYFVGGNNNINGNTQGLYKYDIYGGNGVQQLKVFNGANSSGVPSYVYQLQEFNGSLLFSGYNALTGTQQLWKSDGTSLGNVLLKDTMFVNGFLTSGQQFYFSGNGELWKSDGTADGTALIKEINPGAGFSNPYVFTLLNGKLLFSATDGIHGSELWQSDGTAAGTLMLKDINQTTTAASNPYYLSAFNDRIIFSAYSGNGSANQKLWLSDGTNNGTTVINDTINAQFNNQPVSQVLNDNFYFWNNSASGKTGLFKTDGTAAGTLLVKDFTGMRASGPVIKATGNLVYFFLYNGSSLAYELWRTDGTTANTFIVKNDFSAYLDFSKCVSVGNDLFFFIANNTSLWKTSGTVAGTVNLKNFAYSTSLVAATGKLVFFSEYDGAINTLWKSDGTAGGTVQVTPNVTNPINFAPAGNTLYFTGTGNAGVYGNVGTELFKTDGTENGTLLVKDVNPGIGSSNIFNPVSVGTDLYFFSNPTYNNNNNIALWKSDGTAEGTRPLSNVSTGNIPGKGIGCNGKLFFVTGGKLWQSNGTIEGTVINDDKLFSDITLSDYNANLTAAGDQLFFTASNYKYGQELYAGIISSSSPLPVQLLSFRGTLKNNNGFLEWSTATEKNNSYFDLQRSTDAVQFKSIATVNGRGNTVAINNYSYTDSNITQLHTNKIYYRLKQVDKDGKATLSNIVVINTNTLQPQFTIAPNPVVNSISIYCKSSISNALIKLTDIRGMLLYSAKQDIHAGEQIQIPGSALARGVYIISIDNAGVVTQMKVVKE